MSKKKKDKRRISAPAPAEKTAAAEKSFAEEKSAGAGRQADGADKADASAEKPAAAEKLASADLSGKSAAADALPADEENGLVFHHGRSLPLPLRVKTGSLGDEGFTAETAHEKYEISWDRVKLVCLGFVAERYDTESAAYVTEKMINDVGRMVKGGDSSEGRIVSYVESHVLDVCVEGLAEPLRFESGIINYRAFLGRVSYVSFQNYFKFVHAFVSHCHQARFNTNVKLFLAWQRRELRRCAAFHEHNEEVALSLNKLDSLLRFEDLDLSRTSWAQEWTD